MRKTTNLFLIDGQPMLVPDENVEISMEDIDASDSGRDESGVMYRFVVRHGVGKWTFSYAHLTKEDYAYMEGLFAEKATFSFSYRDDVNATQPKEITAYRSKHSISWKSAVTGEFRNYSFSIIQC